MQTAVNMKPVKEKVPVHLRVLRIIFYAIMLCTVVLYLLPFWGTVDWHDAMQGLRDSGYDGCFNYECRMTKLPPEVRTELCTYAVTLAKRLQSF